MKTFGDKKRSDSTKADFPNSSPASGSHVARQQVRNVLSGNYQNAAIGSAKDSAESRADSAASSALNKASPTATKSESSRETTSTRELSGHERRFFESGFNEDFSGVSLHYSAESAMAARSLNANAFTIGESIHFARPDINFDSASGRKTMAHELAHVVQQRNNPSEANVIRRESIAYSDRVEFDYKYTKKDGTNRSDAATIEMAVMAKIFYNLQQAGHIPSSEHLGDDLNACQQAQMKAIIKEMGKSYSTPDTYEAALRVLVTDANGDGRFDINVDHLSRSGLVNQNACVPGSFLADAIKKDKTPSEKWLKSQSKDADHSNDTFGASTKFYNKYGTRTDEGKMVDKLKNKGFEDYKDRYYDEAKTKLRDLVKAKKYSELVTTAIVKAKALKDANEKQRAAQIIALAFRAVISNVTEIDRLISAVNDKTQLKGIEGETVKLYLSSNLWFDFDEKKGIEIDAKYSKFEQPLKDMISLVTKKKVVVEKISKAISEDIDQTPTLDNLREYMHDIVKSGSLAQVKNALAEVLSTFFIHSGGGVKYPGFDSTKRVSNTKDLFKALSYDAAGRKVLDCDGFVALARDLLDAGTNRFAFIFIDIRTKIYGNTYDGTTHAVMAVTEISSKKGFIVSNEKIEGAYDASGSSTERDLINAIGEGLKSMGYTSNAEEAYMSADQSIYDEKDANRWKRPYWSPSQSKSK